MTDNKPTLFMHPKSTDELITDWKSQGLPLQETEILINRLIVERANERTNKPTPTIQPAFNASGSKYLRRILTTPDGKVDVYAVLLAFEVTCPARQHALKKILCAGQRDKGSEMQDLKEARDAIDRAIQLSLAMSAAAQEIE